MLHSTCARTCTHAPAHVTRHASLQTPAAAEEARPSATSGRMISGRAAASAPRPSRTPGPARPGVSDVGGATPRCATACHVGAREPTGASRWRGALMPSTLQTRAVYRVHLYSLRQAYAHIQTPCTYKQTSLSRQTGKRTNINACKQDIQA